MNATKDIRKFNRFELKYVLPYETAVQMKEDILRYALPDPYGGGTGRYIITSLYYDSPDYRFYREKIDGLKFRRKLRIRWYEMGEPLEDDSVVFMEIKQRVDRVTQKKRFPLRYKHALAFCHEGIMPQCDEEDRAFAEEMYEMIKLYDLRPSVITTYERRAFVGTDYDMGFRLTFDGHVAYRLRDLDLGAGSYDGFMIPPNFVIMEIKTNERVPYWVTEMVANYDLQLVRVSKYCLGLEKALMAIK